MDLQTLWNLCGTAALLTLGYLFRMQVQTNKELREDLTKFRLEVAKDYVTHTDLRRIEDSLVRIEAKLDAKADK